MRVAWAVSVAVALLTTGVSAWADVANVRLLQRAVEDAPDMRPGWVEGGLRFQDFDGASSVIFGARGTAAAGENLELGASIGYASFDVDGAGGADGLFDPEVYFRYYLEPTETSSGHRTQIVLGGALSLPFGDEDLLQGTIDVEGFGALRYYADAVAFMGTLAFRVNGDPEIAVAGPQGDTVEIPGETSFFVGGAVFAPVARGITLIGELDVETERIQGGESDVRLTPSIDAVMGARTHLRGGLGIGLADGSPDVEIILAVAADL